MAARDPEHQRAITRVAILARWRSPDDPELVEARRALAVARAQARLTEATGAVMAAAAELRSLDRPAPRPDRVEVAAR